MSALRDSLAAQREYHRSLYQRFPTRADSISTATAVRLDHLFAADANGISEALRASPKLVRAPFALASMRNRYLLYGYPFDMAGSRCDPLRREAGLSDLSGTDLLSTSEVMGAAIGMPGGVRLQTHPQRLVAPEMSIFWENGVFRENILGVRFARPLTRSVDLGFFSDYRYLAGQTYSHENGDIHGFYAAFVDDTSLLSDRGRNPLTNEQTVGARVRWSGARAGAEVRYKYFDTDNDAVRQNDSALLLQGYGPLEWERVYGFRNDLAVSVRSAPAGIFLLNGTAGLKRDGHRVMPFTRARPERSGHENGWGFSLTPGLGVPGDTISTTYEMWASDRGLYTGQSCDSRDQRVKLGAVHAFAAGPLQAALSASAGHAFLDQGTRGNVWLWDAAADASLGRHSLRLFASSLANPYAAPYDLSEQIPARLWDVYRVLGVEAALMWPKAGAAVSYCYVDGVDSSTLTSAWPHGAAPYGCPHTVVTVAPVLGRWYGLALSGRCMASDAMPYVKAQAAVSYEAALARGRAHVCVDALLDYWSPRREVRFGDPAEWRSWAREIWDVSLRTAVQISTFRLYYKVDNLLNRRIAYVPGYYMPGLTFRWGFGWVIPE